MSKSREQLNLNPKAAFYALLYPAFKEAAADLGYALALHGSMASDMDIIAVPWVDDAEDHEKLVKAISDCIGKTVWKEWHLSDYEQKPHGRITYTLAIHADWYVDLSITPKIPV